MSNSTAWISPDTQANLQFVQNILDIIFKAGGLATMAVAGWNYSLILRAIARVAGGQATQHDRVTAEAALRQGGEPVHHAIGTAASELQKLGRPGASARLVQLRDQPHTGDNV